MKLLHKQEQGAAVVEFAVLFGLLLIFLVGIIEFGFLWIESNYIASAAREGARVAAKIPGNDATAIDAREDAAEAAVEEYLRSSFLFRRVLDDQQAPADFLVTLYTRDPEKSMNVTIDSVNTAIFMAEVTVTVKTEHIWSPLLWPLLSAIIPGVSYSPDTLKQLSQSASFVIENY